MEQPGSRSIFLAHIATLHFHAGLSQTEIAARLGLSKMTVSRSIKRAFDKGLVEVIINEPFSANRTMARRLGARFPGVEFTVVSSDGENAVNVVAGAFSYRFLIDSARGKKIGLGIGSAVASFVAQLTPIHIEDLLLVQMIGGFPEAGEANPFAILNTMTQKLTASGVHFSTIAHLDSTDARDELLARNRDPYSAPTLWETLDTAIFGVGLIKRTEPRTSLLDPHLATAQETDDLLSSGAVAELLGHCIATDGTVVTTGLTKRIATIPIETLRRVPRRIALAAGKSKATAIVGALRSGVISELYTDEVCAAHILDLIR